MIFKVRTRLVVVEWIAQGTDEVLFGWPPYAQSKISMKSSCDVLS